MHKAEFRSHRQNLLWDSGLKDAEGKNIFIPRYRIKDYLTDEFWLALYIWNRTENLGCLPFAGGWAEQPGYIAEILNLFRCEKSEWDRIQWEKDNQPKK